MHLKNQITNALLPIFNLLLRAYCLTLVIFYWKCNSLLNETDVVILRKEYTMNCGFPYLGVVPIH